MMSAATKRFLSMIDKNSAAPCWIWAGPKFARGYGRFCLNGKSLRAHRYSWEHFNKQPVPEGLVICHSCDNKLCVNPDHLQAETQAFNNHEAIERGLWAPNFGTANGRARLTPDQVRRIRESDETQDALAARFGVAQSQIGRIVRGENWQAVG